MSEYDITIQNGDATTQVTVTDIREVAGGDGGVADDVAALLQGRFDADDIDIDDR